MTVVGVEDVDSAAHLLVPYLGVPGAMLAIFIWAMVKGWIITGREADKDREQCQAANIVLKDRLKEDHEDWKGRYEEMKKEKDEWKQSALGSLRALEIATKTAEKAANSLEKKP